MFQKARNYTRDEIRAVLGGSAEDYLPTKGGRVMYGAFRPDFNPDAPTIILPGFGPRIERAAELFNEQGTAVPVFLKRAVNQWQYVGEFRVERLSRDPEEIKRQEKRTNRQGTISMILYLERAS
jgi:hypothetical protein